MACEEKRTVMTTSMNFVLSYPCIASGSTDEKAFYYLEREMRFIIYILAKYLSPSR